MDSDGIDVGRTRQLDGVVWRQRATFDVYGPAGSLLGRVVLPPLQGLIQVTGDQLFAMGKGPDDEQIITMYRMTGLKQ